jgi:TatA/E family protein of Tat protein translocase
MFNVGWSELLIILFLVLLFFGPKRLPELAEALGKSIARFKKASQEIESGPSKTLNVTEDKKKQG